MKARHLFQVLGLLDEDLIDEAWTYAPTVKKASLFRRKPWLRGLSVAACCVLVCTFGFFYLVTGGFRGMGSSAPKTSEGAAPEIAADEADSGFGMDFLSYAGPVLPLTTLEHNSLLTAQRSITWDFAPGTNEDGTPRQWGAQVTDRYTLTNPTDGGISVTALYPLVGSLQGLGSISPEITVNGSTAEAALYAGGYAGTFGDANDADGSTNNLAGPYSWEDYAALVSDERYRADALGSGPELNTPVTVYRFSHFSAPHETYQAATQAVEFTIDEGSTVILSYGFNGLTRDPETGWRQYDYFVPDGIQKESEQKLLVVLGEDLSGYTLQGYATGACEIPIDGVSCTVTREETTLNTVLAELCRTELAQLEDRSPWPQLLSLYEKAAAELLTVYGPLSSNPTDRYSDGRLDDLLGEALLMDRVLYLAVPVAVPAGSSTELSVTFWKEPSYDFGGSGTGREGLQGFDLLTTAGSALDFTGQTTAIVHADGVEILGQDLGSSLEDGPGSVSLDLAKDMYFLEIHFRETS